MFRSFRYVPVFYDGADETPATMDGAAAAAEARLSAAFDTPPATGTPDPAAGSPADQPAAADDSPAGAPPVDLFSDEAIDRLVPDDMPYRDARRLRAELARARERWSPYHEVLGGLDDDTRSQFLEASRTLGGDVAAVTRTFAGLHPSDRQFFLEALDALASRDPDRLRQAAEMFAAVPGALADVLGMPAPAAAGLDEPDPDPGLTDGFADDDPDRPLTRAELDAWYAERQAEADYQEQLRRTEQQIIAELSELGYDLRKAETDPREQWRIAGLLDVAQRHFEGDLRAAHAAVADAWRQEIIDEFVKAKSADAGRPSVPPAMGGAPSEVRELTSLADAEAAMEARLNAAFGPEPRR